MENKVKEIIAEQLMVSIIDVKNESSFIDDLMADSLDCVQLTVAFEDEYSIDIPDGDVDKIKTVGQLLEYLKERV